MASTALLQTFLFCSYHFEVALAAKRYHLSAAAAPVIRESRVVAAADAVTLIEAINACARHLFFAFGAPERGTPVASAALIQPFLFYSCSVVTTSKLRLRPHATTLARRPRQ